MSEHILGPTSHYFYSQRLKLHYVDWGNHDKPLLLLIHGSQDHCRSWDWVALDLRQNFHVVAPDLRGHGDSDWAIGGSYALIDYVLDVVQLMEVLGNQEVHLIGHSLGGAVALQYAGVFPERVKRVVSIEGLGPPLSMISNAPAPERMRQWVADMRALASRQVRRYARIEDAIERMRQANPNLSEEQARHLTVHGVRRNEDGTYSWKFDNYTRSTSPYRFNLQEAMEIWSRIACPTLLIQGDRSRKWSIDWEKDRRTDAFAHATKVTIKGADHWVHHDQLEEFLRTVRSFFGCERQK